MLVTIQQAPYTGTSIYFRAWGSWMSAAIAACGWVQTSDAGQINWLTVTTTGGTSNTVIGYEIWCMNDALQGTAPVFMKLEYGTGSSATSMGLWTQFSTSSDGAGNLNGAASSPRTQVPVNTASGDPTFKWIISGDTNRLTFVMNANVVQNLVYCWFSVERTHASNGADTVAGITYVKESTGPSYIQYFFPLDGGSSPGSVGSVGAFPPTFGTGANGAVTAVYPVFVDKGGPYCNPLKDLIGVFPANYVTGAVVPITLYGANRKYFVPPSGYLGAFSRYGVALKPIFRYE